MQEITGYFRDCSAAMSAVRDEIVNLRTCIDEYYEGLATGAVLDELFLPIDRHVEVLADCYRMAADFVESTEAEAKALDESLRYEAGRGRSAR